MSGHGFYPDPDLTQQDTPERAAHPSLTVVILTYNSAATLGNCLDGLVGQSHPDFSVLLVDDDSEDDTLAVAADYKSSLCLSVVRNGSHNIPRGRNIGLAATQDQIVAFADSDDRPEPGWTKAITDTFREYPETALIAGPLRAAHRSDTAQAIARNDEAIRRLFGGGVIQFCAGNSAINRAVVPDAAFDEDFRAAEDLELVSRVGGRYGWRFVPSMEVDHYSRETFRAYGKQMYRYAFMKAYFSFTVRSYRLIDYVPLALMLASCVASLIFRSWWFLPLIIPFSFLEALFVIAYERCSPRVAVLTFPAWMVKNLCWSYGLLCGSVALAARGNTRRLLRSKRLGRA